MDIFPSCLIFSIPIVLKGHIPSYRFKRNPAEKEKPGSKSPVQSPPGQNEDRSTGQTRPQSTGVRDALTGSRPCARESLPQQGPRDLLSVLHSSTHCKFSIPQHMKNFRLLNRALKPQRLNPQIKIKQMSAGKPK